MPNLVRLVVWLPLPREAKLPLLERAIRRAYDEDIRAAKTADERESTEAACDFELRAIYEESECLHSRRLVRKAIRMHIPLPKYPPHDQSNEHWERARDTRECFLTPQGWQTVRAAIREERRGQWESWSRLLAVVGAVGAIVAAVASVINMLHAK